MLSRLELTTDTSALVLLGKRMAGAAAALDAEIAASVIPASQQRTDASINTAFAPHARPTDFETPKQRRWWFAVGITRWQGRKSQQDWTIEQRDLQATAAQIVAVNPMPGARYVFVEPFVQRMHQGVWMNTDTYASVEAPALVRDVAQAWYRVAT